MTTRYDLAAIRAGFPVTNNVLYLDSAHQTPLATSIRAAVIAFYDEAHERGGPKPAWLGRVEATRARIARFIAAEPDEIAFTKNTSEGLNIAANAIPLAAGDNVLMIEGDHPNNAYAWLNLERRGVEVRFIELADDQVADASTFAPYIDDRTRVITLSHVTFHAGQRHDLASIGQLCEDHGLYLVVDAMQSVGVTPIDVRAMKISVLAAGCHKGLLVSQGLGILYVRNGLDELHPAELAMVGMANPPADYIARPDDLQLRADAGRFELGNLNLPGIHALDASIDLIESAGVANIEAHLLELGDRLMAGLDALGIALVGPRERAGRLHIYVLALPVTAWLATFASENVRVSPERDGVRISFGLFNTVDDVDRVLEIIERHHASEQPMAARA